MINWHRNSAGHYKIQISIKNINNLINLHKQKRYYYIRTERTQSFRKGGYFCPKCLTQTNISHKNLLNIFISQKDSWVVKASAAAIGAHYNIMVYDAPSRTGNSLWKFHNATNSWHISSFLLIKLYELKHTDECNLWKGVLNLSKQLVLLPFFRGS